MGLFLRRSGRRNLKMLMSRCPNARDSGTDAGLFGPRLGRMFGEPTRDG